MTPNPILTVLSAFLKHKIKALLIGGQACILYGAAEFSRDIDLAVMVSIKNLERLKAALDDLKAIRIYVPELSEAVLRKGHSCHFRCQREDVKGLRIDLISVMRNVDAFPRIWKRRQEIVLPGIGKFSVIGLSDLVKAKKTQRDKDWPMLRRLVEADIFKTKTPPADKLNFWLSECRTPHLLLSLAKKYPKTAVALAKTRPLLRSALAGNPDELQKLLRAEEEKEKELDRGYWKPLRAELEQWRHGSAGKN